MTTPIPMPATPEPERDPRNDIDWDLLDQQIFGEADLEESGEDTTCTPPEARAERAAERIDPPPFTETSDVSELDKTPAEARPVPDVDDRRPALDAPAPVADMEPGPAGSMIPTFVDWERAEAEGKAQTTRAAADSKIAVKDAEFERKLRKEAFDEERKLQRETLKDERKARRRAESQQSKLASKARRQAARAAFAQRVRENTVGMYAMTVYATAATVAVGGQISVAAERGWPILFGVGMAVFIEGTALAMALTALAQRLKGEKALLPRALTWLFAFFAAGINYYTHAEDQVLAVILGASSLTAITVYEIRSAAKHRDALREKEMIGAPATQFGWRTWLVHPRLTFAAWKRDVSARLAGEAASLMGQAVAAAERRTLKRAATARVKQARHEAKKAGLPPVILTFTDDADMKATEDPFNAYPPANTDHPGTSLEEVTHSTPEAHTSCTFREKGPHWTDETVINDSAGSVEPVADTAPAPRPKRPRPAPAKQTTPAAERLSDDEVIAALRELTAAEGDVSVKRARREFGLGFERAKRLIEAAARPADGTTTD